MGQLLPKARSGAVVTAGADLSSSQVPYCAVDRRIEFISEGVSRRSTRRKKKAKEPTLQDNDNPPSHRMRARCTDSQYLLGQDGIMAA